MKVEKIYNLNDKLMFITWGNHRMFMEQYFGDLSIALLIINDEINECLTVITEYI